MSRADRVRQKRQPPPIPLSERRRRGRPVTPLMEIDETGLGPAMLALPNAAMRVFVYAKVHLGLSNSKAGRLAGYSARSPNALEVATSRISHDERVQAAMLEEGQKLMRTEGARSIRTLVAIRDDTEADNKDRIRCATELLNRSGFHAVSEHHDHQHVHMSEAEKDRRILALAAEMGLTAAEAQKMLIAPADFQRNADGVFEMPPEPAPEPATDEARACAAKLARDNETRRARRQLNPEELAAHKQQNREARAERLRRERAEHDAARATEADALSPDAGGAPPWLNSDEDY